VKMKLTILAACVGIFAMSGTPARAVDCTPCNCAGCPIQGTAIGLEGDPGALRLKPKDTRTPKQKAGAAVGGVAVGDVNQDGRPDLKSRSRTPRTGN
jgi:hypothetical protein